jgi:hypothetical protein
MIESAGAIAKPLGEVLFGPIGKFATATLEHTAPSYESRIIYLILSMTIATSAGIYVLDVGINVAVEKDL